MPLAYLNQTHSTTVVSAEAALLDLLDADASVDRSRLNSGETVELTVESSDVTQFGKPDLSPLDAQFEVSVTRQINQLTTLGGDNHATTRSESVV